MEYLRGNATASATGLYVICRYLSGIDGGQREDELRLALEVLRTLNTSQDEASAVLKASLAVGEGLGLITRTDARSPWIADKDIVRQLGVAEDSWPWFRGELLFRIGSHAMKVLAVDKKVPDLALGLAWLLQQSPLRPLQLAWGSGPEQMVRDIGFEAVSRSEQWRPFQRWAVATGLARRCDQPGLRVLIPDATTAILDQLPNLPRSATASDWLATLQARLPFLGAMALINELPREGTQWKQLPPGVAIGLLKLEKRNVLSLEASDDATDVVPIDLGGAVRQVGRISVEGLK
jgi:hypothetical protein